MFPIIRFGSGLGALATVWLVALLSSTAMATSINMDEFSVTLNGNPLFDDSFNQNTTLIGGTGTTVASGSNFTGTTTSANYFVHGSIPETTANNGQAHLNTANGIVMTQPDPFFPVISEVNGFLETAQSATGNALTQATSFTVTGLYDLHLPNVVGGTDTLSLTNRYAINGDMGNVLQIRLRDCAPGVGLCGSLSGPVVQFVYLNFITNSDTLISEFGLSGPDLADPQMQFEFMKAANTNVIDACYAFGSGNTLATFTGTPTCFGSTDSSTDIFTTAVAGGDTVRAGFETFEPVSVPEPPSLLLLFSGLLGLAGLAGWRAKKPASFN